MLSVERIKMQPAEERTVRKIRLLVLVVLLSLIVVFYASEFHHEFTLEQLKHRLDNLRDFNLRSPMKTLFLFMGTYVLITSLAIPGAIVLTLLAGALFGVLKGTLIVTVSCTVGATLSFFLSRFLFREALSYRFKDRLFQVNQRLRYEGKIYLFTLRLLPVSPYVIINLLMGLTSMNPWSFIWMTFLGMLPGNFIYVFAGQRIADIKSLDDILTWPLVLLLFLIGVIPFLVRKKTAKRCY